MDTGLLDEVRKLTPLVRKHRGWAEEHTRIAPEVHEALGQVGIFRITAPKEYGGLEADMPDEIAVYEELAFADPSVAWIAMNSSAAGGISTRLRPEAAERLFENPTSIYGFGLASTGKSVVKRGGFHVSGRWPVVSGCAAADWFIMTTKVYDGRKLRRKKRQPVTRIAIIPASEAKTLETWSDVIAVRGSGSHAVEVAGCFVPRMMTSSFDERIKLKRGRFQVPGMSLGSLGMAAVSIGIARSALEAAITQGMSRKSVAFGTEWRDWPSVQDSVAASEAAIYAAREGLLSLTREAWAFTEQGKRPPLEVRARMNAMADHAVRTGREAVSRLFTVGSVDAIHEGHGLERALRDMHGFAVQWERYRRKQFQAGAALLGVEIDDPQF